MPNLYIYIGNKPQSLFIAHSYQIKTFKKHTKIISIKNKMMRRMKFLPIVYILLLFSIGCSQSNSPTSEKQEDEIEKKIDELLAKMTLEEKVGQMVQVTLDVVCKGAPHDNKKEQVIDPEKLKKAIVDYKVGSILNTGAYALPRDKWYELISQIQEMATNETPNGIPVIYGVDAIHGVTYTQDATLFPQQLGVAATWNPKYAEQTGIVTAYETRASAITWNFSPVLDLGRQPLWSRFFETFGEDPYLAKEMGVAIVKGYQGNDVSDPEKVAACLKHYVGYSNSRSGKDRTPIYMTERELREYYLVPFKAAIENGAQTVMINSTEIDGTPVHAHHRILTEILKEELQFDGFAVTDWEDVIMLHTVHNVAKSQKEAAKIAVNAGVDMSMTPYGFEFADHLIELVNEGEIPMERIDDAVRRILRVKFRLGLFENPYYPKDRYPKFGSEEFVAMSYNAAKESITLLKNEGNILPLPKDKKVLVTGVGANSLNALNGAWTHTWQGVETDWNTKGKKTVVEAIRENIGEENVLYSEGATWDALVNINDVKAKAAKADYIIVCIGEKPSTEKPGDIEDLTYPQAQLDLVNELAKTGKPIIAVLTSSRPRLFTSVEPKLKGIFDAYFPGNEGGRAIAETIFGDNNPSGKLPFTYPRYSGSLVTYDHKLSEERDKNFGMNAFNPLFEFGHGLSYTTFEYSNPMANTTSIGADDQLEVSIDVKNTGDVAGKEVVMLFTRDHYATITPSVKRLRRFQKIDLEPGEKKTVTFKINKDDLAFVTSENKWIVEPGKFDAIIGGKVIEFEYNSEGEQKAAEKAEANIINN